MQKFTLLTLSFRFISLSLKIYSKYFMFEFKRILKQKCIPLLLSYPLSHYLVEQFFVLPWRRQLIMTLGKLHMIFCWHGRGENYWSINKFVCAYMCYECIRKFKVLYVGIIFTSNVFVCVCML